MAGSLGCARGTWEPWMTRHWDSLPVTARTFVCVGSVTAASGNLHIPLQRGLLFVAPHSTGKGYRRGLATLVRGSLHEEFLLFPNFPPAVRSLCTTADAKGCGVSMEGTIFIETFSTAACVYAPTRRTVEAREQMSTVLDHLVTHIVDVPFCLARSAEERAHGCSLSLATAACPGTKLVMHKPRRRPTSHSSLTHGPPAWSHWPNVLFVPDSSSQKLTAPLQQATGNPRARTPPSLVGKRLRWPASAAGFRTNTDGCHGHCNPPSRAHSVGAARMPHSRHAKKVHTETPPPPAGPHPATIRRPAGCPVCGKHCSCFTGVVTHMVDAHGFTRSPRRCGSSAFPVSRNRQKSHQNHRPALERGRERETAQRSHLRHRLHSPGRSHPMQFPHGVVGQATRNRTSSSALPQARVPPRNKGRCQEYEGLTASTPF
ncbi:hypothetical protein TcCL_Unassigned05192 [Trypanosoma cruzi]|nr:hypothetical protein TcCL_Unassigned05192 [Trypanosoma cruzi]